MSRIDKSLLNDVKNRFLSLPKSAVEGLEHEPKKEDFNFIKELGSGAFGTVYLVSHKKTKAKYALKAIDKSEPENIEQKKTFNREVEIMSKLNHPNIVKIYGHFEDEKYCYFIMEYIPNKDLFELIPIDGKKPNIKLVASIMKDLLNAVYYLHNMKPIIIHRDIKPENILLDSKNKAYLTDFGWSNYMENFIRRNTVCGTPLYLPPEMIGQFGHDETADIWCIGVLLFELITGTTPFEGNDIQTVAQNISKLRITWPPNMDPDAKDLCSKILKLHGKDRLPIEQILEHKFFSKYFPNAVKELIKPDPTKNRTFVVSKDDPKTWRESERQIMHKPQKSFSNNISNSNNNNNINVNNKDTKHQNIRATYIPKIDVKSTYLTNEKYKTHREYINKNPINNNYNTKHTSNNAKSYHKNNYNNKNMTSSKSYHNIKFNNNNKMTSSKSYYNIKNNNNNMTSSKSYYNINNNNNNMTSSKSYYNIRNNQNNNEIKNERKSYRFPNKNTITINTSTNYSNIRKSYKYPINTNYQSNYPISPRNNNNRDYNIKRPNININTDYKANNYRRTYRPNNHTYYSTYNK